MQRLAKHYLALVSDSLSKPAGEPMLRHFQGAWRGAIRIPDDVKDSVRLKEERYSASLDLKINSINNILDNESPLGDLVTSINKKLTELGVFCDAVEIRFERGCFDPLPEAQKWHKDGGKISMITCYSNKRNWSTRVLDKENMYKIFGNVQFLRKKFEKDDIQKKQVESLSQPAKFGFLYNAIETLHRAPRTEDLVDNTIAVDEYRLFLQFFSI